MNMQQVKEKAEKIGVKAGKKRKADLIREIQYTEGNYPCFGSAVDYCDQELCCWRFDCMPVQREKKTAPVKRKKTVKRIQKKSKAAA